MSKRKPQRNFFQLCIVKVEISLAVLCSFLLCFNRRDLFTLPFVLKTKIQCDNGNNGTVTETKKTRERIMHIWWIKHFICAEGIYIVSGMNFAFFGMARHEFNWICRLCQVKRRDDDREKRQNHPHHRCTIQSKATSSMHLNARCMRWNTSTEYAIAFISIGLELQ